MPFLSSIGVQLTWVSPLGDRGNLNERNKWKINRQLTWQSITSFGLVDLDDGICPRSVPLMSLFYLSSATIFIAETEGTEAGVRNPEKLIIGSKCYRTYALSRGQWKAWSKGSMTQTMQWGMRNDPKWQEGCLIWTGDKRDHSNFPQDWGKLYINNIIGAQVCVFWW